MNLEYVFDSNDLDVSLSLFSQYLINLNLTQDSILLKVNWSSNKKGYFTDLQTLSFFIEGLKRAYPNTEIIIVESYSYERNDPQLEHCQDKELERKDIIRENERVFLESQGFRDYFKNKGCKYINVTEECWAGNTVDSSIILNHINKKYRYELKHPELLTMIPEVLYQYNGKSLISLSKIKGIILPGFLFFTLSQKNLFGLIPNTCRRHYHGKPSLVQTIMDINVVYRSLFDIVGICEALFNTLFIGDQPYVIENSGCILASRDLGTLDATIINSLSFNPFDRHFIQMSEKIFNPINRNAWNSDIIKKYFYPLLNSKINIDKIKNSKEKVEFRI